MPIPFEEIIESEAELFDLTPDLIHAVIEQESSGIPAAFRYEPGFYKRHIASNTKERLAGHWPTDISEEQERTLRACSFGLMQVMGQTAREFGFSRDNLFDLFEPKFGIHFGAMKLAREIEKAKRAHVPDPIFIGLQAYNGGANPNYAPEVILKMRSNLQ